MDLIRLCTKNPQPQCKRTVDYYTSSFIHYLVAMARFSLIHSNLPKDVFRFMGNQINKINLKCHHLLLTTYKDEVTLKQWKSWVRQ